MDIKQFYPAPEPTNNSAPTGAPLSGKIKIAIIVLAVAIIVGAVLYYPAMVGKKVTKEEEKINRQVKELDDLRKQANTRVYSEKELQEQSKELDALRETTIGSDGNPIKAETSAPTEAEIQKQINELDELRKR